jgi:hypothetical protein
MHDLGLADHRHRLGQAVLTDCSPGILQRQDIGLGEFVDERTDTPLGNRLVDRRRELMTPLTITQSGIVREQASDLANRTMADGCVPDRVAMTLNGWSAMSSG